MKRILGIYRTWRLKRHIEKFGSKNNGYFNYFVINWTEYKGFVLWLVNHKNPLIRIWGRHKFRIDQDREVQGKIIEDILPHYYKIKNADGSFTIVFRTHVKYAKRLYYGFYPVWWALHFIDWLLLDRAEWLPDFGLDILTVYPDANPETTTVDGYSGRYAPGGYDVGETWSALRGGTGNAFDESSSSLSCELSASSANNMWYTIYRLITLFNTSSLLSGYNISAVAYSLYCISYQNEFSSTFRVVTSNPSSNTSLSAADYGNIGTSSLASRTSLTGSQYNDWALGTGDVTKAGITKLGVRVSHDLLDTAPTWSNTAVSVSVRSADYTGTSTDPKLVVTYTTSVTEVIAGSAAGIATTAMAMKATKKLVAAAAGVAATNCNLQVGNFVTPSPANGNSTATLALKADKKMVAQSTGVSTAQLKLIAVKKLVAVAAGVCYAVAHVGAYISIAGQSDGQSTAGMNLLDVDYMQMAAQGVSTAQAKLSLTRNLKGVSAGVSTAESNLRTGTHILTLENAE